MKWSLFKKSIVLALPSLLLMGVTQIQVTNPENAERETVAKQPSTLPSTLSAGQAASASALQEQMIEQLMRLQSGELKNEELQQLEKIVSNPAVQKSTELMTDPQLIDGFSRLFTHPNRNQLIFFEVLFVLLWIVFRAWRLSLAKHWARKLWVSAWTFALLWVGSTLVLPWMMFGDTYKQTVVHFYSKLLSSERAPAGNDQPSSVPPQNGNF